MEKSKKIMFLGVFDYGSTNISQSECLFQLGYDVLNTPYREMSEEGIKKIFDEQKPDYVLFSKCNEISNDLFDRLNTATTILWYMDPINSNFNSSLMYKMSHCDVVCCALWGSYEKAKSYNKNVYYVCEGYDIYWERPFSDKRPYNVSFIGNLRSPRDEWCKGIAIKNFTKCYGLSHITAVNQTKVNLNFVDSNCGASDRVYKILAAGGFLLTQPYPNIHTQFKIGADLDIFETKQELIDKIYYYLANFNKRKQIALDGHVTVEKFSRKNWAKKIMEVTDDTILRS